MKDTSKEGFSKTDLNKMVFSYCLPAGHALFVKLTNNVSAFAVNVVKSATEVPNCAVNAPLLRFFTLCKIKHHIYGRNQL